MRPRLFALVCSFAAACSSEGTTLSLTLPDDVAAVAVFAQPVSADGPATSLLPYDGGELALPFEAERYLVLGYTESAFVELTQALGGVPDARPLVPASGMGCEPKLMRPDFAIDTDGRGRDLETPLDEIPDLTAEWLVGICPVAAEDALLASARCVRGFCSVATSAESSCSMAIDWSGCFSGASAEVATFELDWRGRACVTSLQACSESTGALGNDEEPLTLMCPSVDCDFELIAPAEFEDFQVDVAQVVNRPQFSDLPFGSGFDEPGSDAIHFGHLADIAVAEGKVAVAVRPEGSVSGGGTVRILDAETLTESQTSTLSEVFALGASADGFIAVSGSEMLHLSFFDPAGSVKRSSILPVKNETGKPTLLWTADVAVVPSEGVIGIVVSLLAGVFDGPDNSRYGWLCIADLDSLEPRVVVSLGQQDLERRYKIGGIAYSRGQLIVVDTEHGVIEWRDVTSPTTEILDAIDIDGALSVGRADILRPVVLRVGSTPTLFLAMPAPRYGLLGIASSEETAVFGFQFERKAAPLVVGNQLLEDGRMLVGLVEGKEGASRALLGRADPQSGRFSPGLLEVGHGPLTRLLSDGLGGFVGVLPWSGEVFRAYPKTQ